MGMKKANAKRNKSKAIWSEQVAAKASGVQELKSQVRCWLIRSLTRAASGITMVEEQAPRVIRISRHEFKATTRTINTLKTPGHALRCLSVGREAEMSYGPFD